MDREIKFRLYSNTLKVMYSPETEIAYLWSIKEASNGKVKVDDGDILMQFTGLKDKNGKEIYEGDIFKLGTEKEIFEVHFEYGCFMAFCNGKQYGLIGELQICFIDVIGNIYQNAELLQVAV